MPPIITSSNAMIILEEIRHALEQSTDPKEIRGLRDQAETVRHCIKGAAFGLDLLNKAAEVQLRCERRIGQILAGLSLQGGDRKSKNREQRVSLEDQGISNCQSSRWQQEASVPEAEFELYVKQTTEEGRELTSKGLLRLARILADAAKPDDGNNPFGDLTDTLKSLARRQKRFACIYADPPWHADKKSKIARLHERLCRLPVKQVAAQQAHLHLWVPPESLLLGLSVLMAWGFRYKAVLVRGKTPLQCGNYWRQEHDMLLLGVRGALPFRDNNLSSWLDRHDQTPEDSHREICGLIARVSPPPSLDLFGAAPCTGWTTAVSP